MLLATIESYMDKLTYCERRSNMMRVTHELAEYNGSKVRCKLQAINISLQIGVAQGALRHGYNGNKEGKRQHAVRY